MLVHPIPQVIGMLERRAGEDAFRKVIAHLIFVACNQPPAGAPPFPESSAATFLREAGRCQPARINGSVSRLAAAHVGT